MDRVSHLSMDHANRSLMAMSHCLSRSANSCQIRWWNGWSTMGRYSFHFRCNLADRCWIDFLNHSCSMARSLIAIRYLIRFPTGFAIRFAIHSRFGWIDSPKQTRCHWSNWAPSS